MLNRLAFWPLGLLIFVAALLATIPFLPTTGHAQSEETASAASQANRPEPLDEDELEVLVSRIALYPDELVAVIVAASLYPVQVVEAERYLAQVKKQPDAKPDKDWDGSVISLLNYPEIVKMMSEDLNWTEALGNAVTYQQKELLEAIQQLRDKAIAQKVLKSDDKAVVVHENGNVVIQPAAADKIYVPIYEPQMLYDPGYPPAPLTYYSDYYPSYYYPTAPYFPGFITGVIWGAIIDWNDWGIWGGNGNWGNDIDINCRNCFNNRDFNGNIKWNDVDWANVDHRKMSFDKSQFNKINRNDIRRGLEGNDRNNLKNRANDLKRNQPAFSQQGSRQAKDVRKSTLDGLQKQTKQAKRGAGAKDAKRPSQGSAVKKAAQRPSGSKAQRPSGKKKPAARKDVRSKKPSPMGDINRGQKAKKYSNRGGRSMGGGYNRGGRGGGPKIYRHRGGGGFGGGGGRGGGRGGRR
jgi:hypothetical protein